VSTAFRLALPLEIRDAMFAQAQQELPNECCGWLAGQREGDLARVQKRYPLTNSAASPTKYFASERDLLDADRDMREKSLELLAIYHSHPTSDPIPSKTDLAMSYYGSEVVHFIISLKETEPVMRGWRLTETAFSEVEWDLTSDNRPYV
jgi:proteasome lid subunit RPN8/RPN11